MPVQRKLGLAAVLALVMGDMIGSGIFFTPGQLAAVATQNWQVYFFWSLCGLITLCGALTLAEIASLLPNSGASYHALRKAFGPFAAFMQAWIMILISGPGAIAGVAILFGDFAVRVLDTEGVLAMPKSWAIFAILLFTLVNMRGTTWGGRTQILLTGIKVVGLLALIFGALFIAEPAQIQLADSPPIPLDSQSALSGFMPLLQFVGVGVAIVLFTYDGWIDASNVAGEVEQPNTNFPLAMGIGVTAISLLYLLTNYAFLRVVPLQAMRAEPTTVAATVAETAFGMLGGSLLNGFIWISVFGALGGLIMTLPRLYYAAASEYKVRAENTRFATIFNVLSYLSPKTSVPSGAILASAVIAIIALLIFGSFSRIVTFFVVPFQCINILMVASIFRLRPALSKPGSFKVPLYPVLPLVFIVVMTLFLIASVVYNPYESAMGIVLSLCGIPVYRALVKIK